MIRIRNATLALALSSSLTCNPVLAASVAPTAAYQHAAPSVLAVRSIGMRLDPFDRANAAVLEQVASTGSGFVVDRDGKRYVVTNAHVVEGAPSLRANDREARVVGIDRVRDVAVLEVPSDAGAGGVLQRPLELCANSPEVGAVVAALGSPFGFEGSLSVGIVSGLGRELDFADRFLIDMLQSDAAINPGNSGGPLLDLDHDGCVIGMNTAVVAPGVGFAVPAETLRIAIDAITNQDGADPLLGIELLPQELTDALGIKGAVVANVLPGSPAENAALVATNRDAAGVPQIADVIVGFDALPVERNADLYAALRQDRQDSTHTLLVTRGGQTISVTVQLSHTSVE